MKNILFIHQSAELYGSDKTLLLLIKHLDKTKYQAVVILPNEGELKIELEKEKIKVFITPVLKLYRKMFTPKNIFLFVKNIKIAFEELDVLNKEYKFDLVYSNTLAVLLGFFYARKRNIKHLWHVHEIIEKPVVFSTVFRKLLRLKSNTLVVYNSIATQNFWRINKNSKVIWNGLEIPQTIPYIEINQIRQTIFSANDSKIIIALVGRISSWKGQQLLLRSFFSLAKDNKNILLTFVGSPPPNQELFLNELRNSISDFKIENQVIIVPFYQEISKIWQSIDIAVIPSIEPEPFGLVAVEAMLAKKPVVATNHGGLKEIVNHNETGFLVNPNDEVALAEALKKLIDNSQLRSDFGIAGYETALSKFTIEKHVNGFETIFSKL